MMFLAFYGEEQPVPLCGKSSLLCAVRDAVRVLLLSYVLVHNFSESALRKPGRGDSERKEKECKSTKAVAQHQYGSLERTPTTA